MDSGAREWQDRAAEMDDGREDWLHLGTVVTPGPAASPLLPENTPSSSPAQGHVSVPR